MMSSLDCLRYSKLAQNTLWMLGGRGARMVLQAVYFLLIARALGPAEYGAFVGAVALIAIVSPFSACGTGFLLVEQVARDRTAFPRAWGNALSTTCISGIILLGLVLVASHLYFGSNVPITVVLMVGIADLLAVRILDLVAQAFQAVEILQKNAELYVALGIGRTGAAIVFITGMLPSTATSWATMYLIAAIIAALYALIALLKSPLGLPRSRFHLSFSEFRQGLYYAIGLASQTAYNDIDKAMLLRLASLEATGIYGAAYRIVDVAFQPVASLTAAAYPRFFRHGNGGISESLCFAKRLMRYAGIYGLIAGVLLFLFAPFLPVFIGHQFAATSEILMWLSPIVYLRTVHYFFSNALTGAGLQGIRTAIQVALAVVNVLLNLWLIPLYSWRGAAWSSVITDGLLLVSVWIAAELLSTKSETSKSEILGVEDPT